jgi:hypothetical protein
MEFHEIEQNSNVPVLSVCIGISYIYMMIVYSYLYVMTGDSSPFFSFPYRVLPVLLAPEAPPDPQELTALRDLLVVLETLDLLERR